MAFTGEAAQSGAAQADSTTPPKAPAKAKAPRKATIGQPAPDFTLTDTEGKQHSLSDFKGKIVVLEWYNPDCPFSGKASGQSVHKRGTVKRTKEAARKIDENVVYLMINSTSNAPKDAVLKRTKDSKVQWKIDNPILIDYGGETGRLYDARTTPHMYVINADGVLIYEGGYTDDQRGGKGDKETNYVVNAVSAAKSGETCAPAQTRSWGCGVKYPR
jgi:cytochrome oxidase Cu insertion factor (SCO1/SenC/PrrC family)